MSKMDGIDLKVRWENTDNAVTKRRVCHSAKELVDYSYATGVTKVVLCNGEDGSELEAEVHRKAKSDSDCAGVCWSELVRTVFPLGEKQPGWIRWKVEEGDFTMEMVQGKPRQSRVGRIEVGSWSEPLCASSTGCDEKTYFSVHSGSDEDVYKVRFYSNYDEFCEGVWVESWSGYSTELSGLFSGESTRVS
jgi:hypothetical protein